MMRDYFHNKLRIPKYVALTTACLCMIFISQALFAQLVITSPLNNQVVQRSQTDSATIAITGYMHLPYAKMEISLEAVSGTMATNITQTVPDEQLSQGFFHSRITTKSGWYRLQLTAWRADGRQDTASVSKVAVGEVFLVAGNSNAMGVPDMGAVSASPNVVSFDTVNKYLNDDNITVAHDEPMRSPTFSQFNSQNFAYPAGETSWLWGELGDMLYKRFGTPVLFLNAGWAAASSINYREAASGKDTFNNYVGKNWPFRQPYSNIPNTLRFFNSSLGIRAVLWSHGENDAYHVKIDQASYFTNIQYLIQRVREDFGFNVPWVIGLSTVTRNENKPYPAVIQAQTALGTLKDFNTWLGPDTDSIQVPRPNHGHFENVNGGIQGLTLAAKAWNRTLPDSFFKTVAPIQPKSFIHTGVVPASAFPGATFTLPFVNTDSSATPSPVRAELLTENGRFVVVVGTGTSSPLTISIPSGVLNGFYRIRIVATKPILVGTVSELIDIHRKYNAIGYIRAMKQKKVDNKIEFSWMMSANPGVTKITLQKSADYFSYIDLIQFPATGNQEQSGVYAYADTDPDQVTMYYRIRMDYSDGSVKYSGGLVIFRDDAPPSFVVFPNPTPNQSFFIKPEIPDQAFSCSLFDVTGREHTVVTDVNEIIGLVMVKPVYSVSAGIYILKIKTETGITSQRIFFR